MTTHAIVPREKWLEARRDLLAAEKDLTHRSDQVAELRRKLPWVRVEQPYVFEGPDGEVSLADLFADRNQLLVQHFMLAPGWKEGCKSCSYMADHNDGANQHLVQRDVTLLAVSRAPLAELLRFRERMGWQFDWVSSHGSDFNRDFGVNFDPDALSSVDYNYVEQPFPHIEAPGISVFYRDADGQVFHTYSRYGRGVEVMMHTYALLDLTPKGRDEDALEFTMAWVRHHDCYEPAAAKSACCAS